MHAIAFWGPAVVLYDVVNNAVVFRLVSIYDCIALGNLSA